jgi:hypothetical protein
VNIESGTATVTLTAYSDSGTVVTTETMSLAAHEKVVRMAESMFTQSLSSATYIGYSSDRELVGFQLKGSTDGMMLDGLPGI